MQSKEEILSLLKKLKKEIQSKYRVKNIGIFGSYVNNMQNEKSDIDLLVEFDDKADLIDFMGLSLFLEGYFDKNIDLVSKFALKEELRDHILNEVIYA